MRIYLQCQMLQTQGWNSKPLGMGLASKSRGLMRQVARVIAQRHQQNRGKYEKNNMTTQSQNQTRTRSHSQHRWLDEVQWTISGIVSTRRLVVIDMH